jgi:hypothetical protein
VLGFQAQKEKVASNYPAKRAAGEHQKEMIMEENVGQSENVSNEARQTPEESPSEKLEGDPPTGSLIPGPENPESEEIKKEVNPNTE